MARVRAVLDSLTDVTVKASLQEETLSRIRPVMRAAAIINPYSVPNEAADALETMGILSDPFSVDLHPHAGCKAIENKLLDIVGKLLRDEKVTTYFFLKKSKRNNLKRHSNKDIFQNKWLEPRDFSRYPPDSVVPRFNLVETPTAYISDSLHFMSQKSLLDMFDNCPVLQTVYATIVLPPEALFKHRSLEPALYSINYNYGGFQYLPGGHAGGSYSHEFNQLDWLKVGTIRYNDDRPESTIITAQMLESMGANHLFVFSRGKLLTPRVRTFRADEMVYLPQIFHPKELNTTQPIKKTLAMQLLLYAKSLKTVTLTDIVAKIRQLIQTKDLANYDPDEIVHLANYFFFTAKTSMLNSYDDILSLDCLSQIMLPIKSRLVKLKERLTGASPFRQFLKALEWTTMTYAVEVEDVVVTIPLTDHPWPVDERPPEESDDEKEGSEDSKDEKPDRSETSKQKQDVGSSTAPPQPVVPWAEHLDILNKHGFRGNEIQLHDGGVVIPILDINSKLPIARAPDNNHVPWPLIRKLKMINRMPTMVPILSSRAAPYASDIKNNRVGAYYRKIPQLWRDKLSLDCEGADFEFPMSVIHGAGGSGKSQHLQEWLTTLPRDYKGVVVVLPTVELRTDWVRKVPTLDNRVFKTFEKALERSYGTVVIFDDYGKLPAGYIEAFLYAHRCFELAILTGDPSQAVHHEPNLQASSYTTTPGIDYFAAYSRFYINATHRNRKDLANALNVYSEKEGTTAIHYSSNVVEGQAVLCPTTIKQKALQELGHKALTYSSCQGLTAPKIQILLDSSTPQCSSRVMYTALSRATDSICFINTSRTTNDFWDKLNATPYLKTFIESIKDQAAPEERAPEPEITEVMPATHFPPTNTSVILEDLIEELPEKHAREIYASSSGYSNAVQTEDRVVQLFPHQQAKDETLLWATIAARLSISTPQQNLKELALKKDIGDILFFNYKEAMGLPSEPIPFNQDLWRAARTEVEKTYLQKPVAMLINALTRQSPDFPRDKISLFLKSQWVKKTEKLGCIKIKPGQTIASFMQEVVLLFGTMARYMRRMRQAYQPPNILINCEVTPADLNEFISERWCFTRPSHENDFTAFDQSQDGAMLQFEPMKAKFHNIPEDVIEGYKQIKTNASIFLGTLGIMRLTGEGPTFDANTECSIAYHHTRFQVTPGSAQLYAGDDMAQDSIPMEKPSFSLLRGRLALDAKPIIRNQKPGDFASFCGWRITPLGVIKDPLKQLAGLELAERTGKIKETALSYAHDTHYAYRHSDRLHEIFTEREGELHQAVVRKLHLHHVGDALAKGPT
ncbi:RNA-dependent RNA polymerase [Cassava virus X]|uniref:RNA replication protein n=1 Tax=Cassava virus X TaxID=1977392 RepID=A0A1W5VPI1_9VIRU|nr:RNA-dependent RNA polymerase [Cassava virus X]ARG47536.1 RNA-dependent RNA polymerase [Cassava virus X]